MHRSPDVIKRVLLHQVLVLSCSERSSLPSPDPRGNIKMHQYCLRSPSSHAPLDVQSYSTAFRCLCNSELLLFCPKESTIPINTSSRIVLHILYHKRPRQTRAGSPHKCPFKQTFWLYCSEHSWLLFHCCPNSPDSFCSTFGRETPCQAQRQQLTLRSLTAPSELWTTWKSRQKCFHGKYGEKHLKTVRSPRSRSAPEDGWTWETLWWLLFEDKSLWCH